MAQCQRSHPRFECEPLTELQARIAELEAKLSAAKKAHTNYSRAHADLQRERDSWKATATSNEERITAIQAQRDEARAEVERLRALLMKMPVGQDAWDPEMQADRDSTSTEGNGG